MILLSINITKNVQYVQKQMMVFIVKLLNLMKNDLLPSFNVLHLPESRRIEAQSFTYDHVYVLKLLDICIIW